MKNPLSFFRIPEARKARVCLAAAAILVILGLIWAVCFLMDPYDGRILEGVSIGGLEVGGMTRQEAVKALKQASEEILTGQPLRIRLPEASISLSPEQTQLRLHYRKALREAYRVGRTGTPEEKASARNQAGQTGYQVGLLPYLSYDEEALRSALEDYARHFDTTLCQYSCRLEGEAPRLDTVEFQQDAPCQTLLLTLGTPEAHLDVDAALAQIEKLLDVPFSPGAWGVTLEVIPTAVPDAPDLDRIRESFRVEPVNDSLDMETWQLVPGSYGLDFDRKAAESALEKAAWGETVSIPMNYVRPEILGEEVYFRDVLGHCETKHNTNENRNTNLRLLCQALDGLVLAPGETFSYNDALGERTREKGYLPAPAYSGKRLTDAVGGGVCQGSTTLYNCVLLADLEVLERSCHGAPVTYVPFGLDAAVNWGTTDFQFRNSSHFPIQITAQVSDGYVRMQILGTDEKDYYVEMTSGYDDSIPAITYAVSYKCKYSKETGELLSKEREAFSTYYRNIG